MGLPRATEISQKMKKNQAQICKNFAISSGLYDKLKTCIAYT